MEMPFLQGVIPSDDPEERAMELIEENRLEEAHRLLDQAIVREPWRLGLKQVLAQVHIRQAQFPEAQSLLRVIQPHSAADPEYYALMAVLARSNGKQSAVMEYEQHIQNYSGDPMGMNVFMADLLIAIGEYRQAKKILKSILRDHPDHAEAWDLRGMCEYRLNHWSAMVECLKRTLKLKPQFINTHGGLILAYFYAGLPQRAIQEFDRQPSPGRYNDHGTLVLIAQLLRLNGQSQRAWAILEYVFGGNWSTNHDLLETVWVGRVDCPVDDSAEGDAYNFAHAYLRGLVASRNPITRKAIKTLFNIDSCKLFENSWPFPDEYQKILEGMIGKEKMGNEWDVREVARALVYERLKFLPGDLKQAFHVGIELRSIWQRHFQDPIAKALLGGVLVRYLGTFTEKMARNKEWRPLLKGMSSETREGYRSLIKDDPFGAPVYQRKFEIIERYSRLRGLL